MSTHIWKMAYQILLIGLVVFGLYFGTPVVGVPHAFSLFERLGCSIPFDYTPPCMIYGYDIGPRIVLYKIPFVNLIITPISFLFAFREILAVWVAAIAFCVIKSKGELKTFNVYQNAKNDFELVKVGFSWPALFFGFLWLAYKRLWFFLSVFLALGFVFWFTEDALGQVLNGSGHILISLAFLVLNLGLWLWPAFKGNGWWEKGLFDRGYKLVGSVNALTFSQAHLKIHESRKKPAN